MRPRHLLSWLPLTMLLVFAIASRTICTPSASTASDASPAELHALAVSLFRQPLSVVESQLGASSEGLLHILYDSSGKAKSVLVCQLRPDKTLLSAWPPPPQKPHGVQLAKR